MGMSKKQLLETMMLTYWEYDTTPQYTGDDDDPEAITLDSPEDLILKLYNNIKINALYSYPWRSAIRYATFTKDDESMEESDDKKYKYQFPAPEDFVKEDGFWRDTARYSQVHNEVEAVGNILRTNLPEFTMGYIANITEEEMDPTLQNYLMIALASDASDVGGQSDTRKNFLFQQKQLKFISESGIDYKMSHREDVSDSIHQFSDIY